MSKNKRFSANSIIVPTPAIFIPAILKQTKILPPATLRNFESLDKNSIYIQ